MTQEPNADKVDQVEEAGPATAGPAGPDAVPTDATTTQDEAVTVESASAESAKTEAKAAEREPEQPPIVVRDKRKVDAHGGQPKKAAEPPTPKAEEESTPFDAELDALRHDLGEMTRDLQRVTAEYANYRKRVDRDRTLVAEQATGTVLTQLLPVLDDLDRARNHGDLVGPFATVADQLTAALGKFGLTAFGDPGDPFDPTLHEAVSHTSSPDVTETTCVEIMRRGYLLGERLLRPALVAVADPE